MQQHAPDAWHRYPKIEGKQQIWKDDEQSEVAIVMGKTEQCLVVCDFKLKVYRRGSTKTPYLGTKCTSCCADISEAFLHRPHLQGKRKSGLAKKEEIKPIEFRKFTSIIGFMFKRTTNKKKSLTANSLDSLTSNLNYNWRAELRLLPKRTRKAIHQPFYHLK